MMQQERYLQLKMREKELLAQKLALMKNAALVHYHPNSKQAKFHAASKDARERLFLAGNRCGKTWCGAMEMAMHLTGRYPTWWQGMRFDGPIKAWAASITTEATRDILQQAYVGNVRTGGGGAIPIDLIIGRTMRRGVADAIDTLQVRHIKGGTSVLGFKSYDQGREKFQGTSRHLIHLDEEPDMDIYEECLLRTLDVQGHMMLTMTPLKGMTALCEQFMTAEEGTGKTIVQASWDDTTHLAEDEKNRLRASLRPHEVEAREKGIPSLGSGRVFPVTEESIITERFEIPDHFKRVFGLDFGWTNPTACIWGAYDDDEDIIYLYDYYRVAEQTPAEHARRIKCRGEWIPGVCDPAGQSAGQADGLSLIERYAEHGINLAKADNTVEAGLMQVLERLQQGRLKVFADLEGWLEEFRLYRRDKNGKIVKNNDHLMDATRYLVASGLGWARAKSMPQFKRQPTDWTTV